MIFPGESQDDENARVRFALDLAYYGRPNAAGWARHSRHDAWPIAYRESHGPTLDRDIGAPLHKSCRDCAAGYPCDPSIIQRHQVP